jgi:hypothetical protein
MRVLCVWDNGDVTRSYMSERHSTEIAQLNGKLSIFEVHCSLLDDQRIRCSDRYFVLERAAVEQSILFEMRMEHRRRRRREWLIMSMICVAIGILLFR